MALLAPCGRSTLEFLTNDTNALNKWIRLPGDIVFVGGGLLPLLYLCCSRLPPARPRLEAGRFHRGLGVMLVALAALIAIAALIRNHQPAELAALASVLLLTAVVGRHLAPPAAHRSRPRWPRAVKRHPALTPFSHDHHHAWWKRDACAGRRHAAPLNGTRPRPPSSSSSRARRAGTSGKRRSGCSRCSSAPTTRDLAAHPGAARTSAAPRALRHAPGRPGRRRVPRRDA